MWYLFLGLNNLSMYFQSCQCWKVGAAIYKNSRNHTTWNGLRGLGCKEVLLMNAFTPIWMHFSLVKRRRKVKPQLCLLSTIYLYVRGQHRLNCVLYGVWSYSVSCKMKETIWSPFPVSVLFSISSFGVCGLGLIVYKVFISSSYWILFLCFFKYIITDIRCPWLLLDWYLVWHYGMFLSSVVKGGDWIDTQ